MEKERGKGREKRKSGGIFRSFQLELGSPDWKQRGRGSYSPAVLCTSAPMQKKCMAVRPEKPATRCSSMAQGARSQGAHRPSQAAMSSLLMLADMPQPLHSSQTTQPATLCLRAAFLQESTPVIHTHGHTDLAHIFRHSYHTHTHKQILGSSLEISHLQLLDSSLRSMLSPEKL